MSFDCMPGDFTRQESFDKVFYGEGGNVITASFDPPPGEDFVTLLVGSGLIDQELDLVKMLAQIGLVQDGQSAQEILNLKAEIEDLKRLLAAKEA